MRTYLYRKTNKFQNIFTSKIIILKIVNSASKYLEHILNPSFLKPPIFMKTISENLP